ncbi:TetR/AcrR family transcriptional regulator [Nocardiopsis sp. MG754419]|uniref:TetR/AcrR family transcriptional regulator n=1 Tax=Nocardiopsis sp. MG754419 TaxID=2259865 RepID=UPI0027DCBFF5|nr:TetR/AcrR family transcriptional regulator [Nocardiopsis sp. MG754419]
MDTAIALVEAEGLSALTMRALGERLGVAPGTLYTYVKGRAALMGLLLDAVVARDGLPHEHPGDWSEKLEAWARRDWVEFREKPWVLELRLSVSDFGPAMLTWLDSAIRVFDGTGLSAQTRLDMIEALDAYVRGAATVAVQSTAGGGAGDPMSDRGEEIEAAYLQAEHIQWTLTEGAVAFSGEGFEFGLRSLLAGFRTIADEELNGRTDG